MRPRRIAIALPVMQEDTRPVGALRFADPSAQGFASAVHTFDAPTPNNSHGRQDGARSNFGSKSPWANAYGGDEQLRAMNRKRGFEDGEQEQ